MGLPLDIAYTLAFPAFAPALLRKRRTGLRERMGHTDTMPPGDRPRLLIHAVSVGETNLIAPLVRTLVNDYGIEVVVSVTTDTGIARARTLYAHLAPVVRFPLDFSRCVRRFLDALNPDAVALAELELWPNFAQECARRAIPLAIINGRLSARSFKGYRKARPFLARSFGSLALCAVQDEEYAERFAAMGVPRERVRVTGSMKWDSVEAGADVPGVNALAERLGIDRTRPLIVAGSTAPDEHALLRDATPDGVQLLCAPRRPEWFAQAVTDLPGCAVWSRNQSGSPTGRFVLDTIGELRRAYAMADVVVIGRSFGDLHGSDPMEPAALGKPLVIGPRFGDFTQSVEALRGAGALRVVERDALAGTLSTLIEDCELRRQMGEAALECVRTHRGASARHAELLLPLLSTRTVRASS